MGFNFLYFLTSPIYRRQLEYLTEINKSFVITLKCSGPRTDPWGTEITSYGVESGPRERTWNKLLVS